MTNDDLLAELERVAKNDFGGHFTIMKFTTNWRVGFGTPGSRCDIDQMWEGKTFAEAAERALKVAADGVWIFDDCATHLMLLKDGFTGQCPYCGDVLPAA